MSIMNMLMKGLLLQLGYGKEGNSPDEDELIKWHADELYQKEKRDKDTPEKDKPSTRE
jgi:hypothetical protein